MSARILVVDDTQSNLQILSAILRSKGYQVEGALDGKQALEMLEQFQPDLILLDVMMPEMDGLETCRWVKASPPWQHSPIICHTAKTAVADIVVGFEAGAVDYVAKPFNRYELLARVNTHLMMDELRRDLAVKNAELARAHELVRGALGRYVSEEVAISILKSPEGLDLGGEEREVSILMSDLRGFTAIASRLGPHEVIDFLNLYLDAMVETITRYGGTIDEIIGDAIMVIFGAPVSSTDHAERAVACALAMQGDMPEVNRRLRERGCPEVEMGIGVHTGTVVVGNIGSLRRTKYAAVGNNVNLAGRVESFTTGGQVLISEETRQQIQGPLGIDSHMEIEPKGAAHRMELYAISSLGDLQLPFQRSTRFLLDPPWPVRFTVLEEKFVGRTVLEGLVSEISEGEACLKSPHPLLKLCNLKLSLGAGAEAPEGEIYAKVLETDENSSLIRFTSVSPDLKAWIRAQAALRPS